MKVNKKGKRKALSRPRKASDLKAVLVIDRLSPKLRSDVLRDGVVAKNFDLGLTRTFELKPGVTVNRDNMFAAFKRIADGEAQVKLKVSSGQSNVFVTRGEAGAAIITLNGKEFQFESAELLASNPEQRLSVFDEIGKINSLSVRQESELRAIIQKPDYGQIDFDRILEVVGASPESFAGRLINTLRGGQLNINNLVPDDIEYWYAICPVPQSSETLEAFIANELHDEWQVRLARRPLAQTFRAMCLTFAASALVPNDLVAEIEPRSRRNMLEIARTFSDPFAIVGTIQICASLVSVDRSYFELGAMLLGRLFDKMEYTENALDIYGVTFMAATAFLTKHAIFRKYPAYWRRLVAASHAALVVQTFGVTMTKQEELLPWVWNQSGQEYLISVSSDIQMQRRWLPEWVTSDYLIADVIGRLQNLVTATSGDRFPAIWTKKLDAAKRKLSKKPTGLYISYPGILEGGLPVHNRSEASFGESISFFHEAANDPTLENFLVLQPMVHGWGIPPGLGTITSSVLVRLRQAEPSLDDQIVRNGLAFAGRIAVQLQDRGLADSVVDVCFVAVSRVKQRDSVFEAILRIIECSGTSVSTVEASEIATRRLERLGSQLMSPALLSALAWYLNRLARVNDVLGTKVGRARALARLHARGGLAA